MRRRAVSAVLLGLAAAAAAATPSAIPVGGRVVASGRPLAGATVELQPVLDPYRRAVLDREGGPETPAARVRSGSDGTFMLLAPGPGMWRLLVRAVGRVPMEWRLVPLFEETVLPPVEPPPDAGLAVTVRDSAGRPAAGARVRADGVEEGWEDASGWRPFRPPVLADGSGRAVLPHPAGERVAVSAWAPGWGEAEAVTLDGPTAELTLTAGKDLDAVLLDAAGRPLPGAEVRVGRGAWSAARSRGDGGFRLTVPVGRCLRLLVDASDGRRWEELLPAAGEGGERQGARSIELPPARFAAGVVTEAGSGRPLAGAWAWPDGVAGAWVRSGQRGGFRLPLVGSGPAAVRAAALDHRPGRRTLTAGSEIRREQLESLALEPAWSASGRVVDGEGVPLVGSEVVLRPVSFGPGRKPAMGRRRATAGPRGHFVFSGLTPGVDYEARASYPGLAPADAAVPGDTATARRSPVEIVLRPGATITGRAVTADGSPVAGARVRLLPPRRSSIDVFARLDARPMAATSDGEGVFVVGDLPAGRYLAVVEASGLSRAEVPGVELTGPGDRRDLGEVVLEPGCRLELRVVDPAGRAVGGARATVYEAGRVGLVGYLLAGPIEAQGDEEGRVTLRDLRPGARYHLHVGAPGYLPRRLPGVPAGGETPLRVELRRGARLAGRVLDPRGDPVVGASVVAAATVVVEGVYGNTSRTWNLHTTTGAEGRFAFDAVEPATVHVEAEAPGYARVRTPPRRLGEETVVGDFEIRLEPEAVVAGRVLGTDGSPVPGAMVTVAHGDEGPVGGGGLGLPTGTADAFGEFEIGGIPPGAVQLVALSGARKGEADLLAGPGENRVEIVLAGGRGGSEVSGRVLTEEGRPVGYASVDLRRVDGTRSFGMGTSLGGAFRFGDVVEGDYELTADAPGLSHASIEIHVGQAPVGGLELRCGRGAAIVGRLSGVGREELGRVVVEARKRTGWMQHGQVDFTGGYRVEGLEPGSWQVRAELPDGGRQARGEVEVPEGVESVALDLDLAEGVLVTGHVRWNGAPAVRASVILIREGTPGSEEQTSTDFEGGFRLALAEPGKFTLFVRTARGEAGTRRVVDVLDERELEVDLRTGRLRGRVLAEDGQPLAGALVELHAAGGPVGGIRLRVESGADGSFVLPYVPLGAYRLAVHAEGYGSASADVQVEGSEVDGVELVLPLRSGG